MVIHRSEETTGIGQNIDRYLSAMESIGFSGAIIVSHQGRVVLKKGYGLADRESRRPYSAETVQSLGSLAKQITGAAILLLENQGKLSVDDSISLYFKDIPEEKQSITIHQLLTHSSGLPGGIGPDDEPIGKQAFMERLMAEPLQFDPGSGYSYSNAGYSVLGMIIEQVSGLGYEEFLRTRLFLPAGMKDTGYILPGWNPKQLAEGYRKGELWGRVYQRGWMEKGPGWHLRANGGLHTTVDDMQQWLNTIRGHGVLPPETTRRWTTGYVREGDSDSRYGYGWVDHNTEWGRMVSHSGSNRIFTADLFWLPGHDLIFYIHSNNYMFPAYRERGPLLRAALDPDFQMPPLVKPFAGALPEESGEKAGKYRLKGGSVELTSDDTRLVAKLYGQPTLDLFLKHTEEQKRRFAGLNKHVESTLERLEKGQEDALAGIAGEHQDPVEATRILLDRIAQIGNLQTLHLIGTFENAPDSPLAGLGPMTTFVYAEFRNWNQYWNMVWNEDGTYRGTYSGPWPSFFLIPTAKGKYKGVRPGPPWETVNLHFEGDCLVIGQQRACRGN